jgi:hypothetical protein
MDVHVGHGFAGILAVVDGEAEAFAAVCDAHLFGDFACGEEERSEGGLVVWRGGSDPWYGLAGDDEEVNGGLWADVAEGKAVLVFIDDVGWDFAVGDLLKEGLWGAHDRLSKEGRLVAVVEGAVAEGLDLVDEFADVFELTIDGGVAHIGDVVDGFESTHDLGSDD